MKTLIEAIVRALVDRPDEVQIKEVIGEPAPLAPIDSDRLPRGPAFRAGGLREAFPLVAPEPWPAPPGSPVTIA